MKQKPQDKKPSGLLLNLVVVIFLVLILAVAFFPQAAKALFTRGLSKATGLAVTIRQLDFNFSQPQLLFNDLLLRNPQGFPEAELAKISKVKLHYVPAFALLGQLNLKKVEIDFNELRLIRNEAGDINLPSTPPLQAVGDVIIEELVLDLKSLTYTDLSGQEPVQKTFDVGLEKAVYRNVKGVAGIMEIVSWEVMKRTGIEAKTEPQAAPAATGPEPSSQSAETAPPAEAENPAVSPAPQSEPASPAPA